ncbi:MAG: DUF3467 domain-containing protein [Planctomycetaceae bacterium]|nr:DUF3467 domain-containing protein [Planctomycetaceae bacterium]
MAEETPIEGSGVNVTTESGAESGVRVQQAQQQQTITLDDTQVEAIYANLCRVSSTPEEVILDLALNPNPVGGQDATIRVSQRVILNHFTAKRLAALLAATVQRHEQTFGVLETDVRKRVKTGT